MKVFRATLILAALFLAACRDGRPAGDIAVDLEMYAQIQERLLAAQPGEVVTIPAGTFHFDRPLSLDGTPNVTIRGAGMDATVLSFKAQKVGAEGLKITADSVTVEDLTIVDSKGDAIKIQDSKSVTLRRVKTTWSGGAKETNGAYGLYPVACQGVLIEGCVASFASDAGIYVGQCRDVVVRDNHAHENVAGIEIENCIDAEVYGNLAENNTGGILVFDLPELPAGNGRACRVYRNRIVENNLRNFAPEGNIVGIVPPGAGMIILAAKDVEVFDNEFIGHKTFGMAIASYHITEKPYDDPNYDPFARDIFVYNNTFERKRAIPDLSKDFGKMVNFVFKGRPQDILYDGIIDPALPAGRNPMNVCVDQPQEGLRFANIDAANEFKQVDKDISRYACRREAVQ
jgi:parallel beta-helix repeat protein